MHFGTVVTVAVFITDSPWRHATAVRTRNTKATCARDIA